MHKFPSPRNSSLQWAFAIYGAYSLRSTPEDSRDFGIRSMHIQFAVIGPKGAVSASIKLPWYLPQDAEGSFEMLSKYPFGYKSLTLPEFTDIGRHAEEPESKYDNCTNGCHLTHSGKCHYDGTSLWGNERWREGFLHGGSEWLLQKLEDYYMQRYEDGPAVDFTPVPRQKPPRKEAR